MIYFTSDLHCGHVQILNYEPKRQTVLGTTIEEHDTTLLNRINSKVQPDDVLIITGDFSLSDKKAVQEYRKRINCTTVIIVLGNHDRSQDYYKCGFQAVCYEMVVRISGEYVRLRHHPYRKPWYKAIFPWQYKERDRNKRPINHGHYLIHGHIHSGGHRVSKAWRIYDKQLNVGVDVNKYYPVSIKEVESIIAKDKSKRDNKRRRYEPCTVLRKIKRMIRIYLRNYPTKT